VDKRIILRTMDEREVLRRFLVAVNGRLVGKVLKWWAYVHPTSATHFD
jgi:hypothetical protein